MTRILLDLRGDSIGTTAPLRGVLTARRTRIRVDGAVVTYPTVLTFRASDEINLAPPLSGEAWILELRIDGAYRPIRRTVRFAQATVAWSDLIDIDPATLQPLPDDEQLAAWEAVQRNLDDVLAGIAVGPAGPQGPQGIAGPRGDPGAKGDTGAQGARGLQGNPGQQGTQGPQGDIGPRGPQGVQGDAGQRGDTGARGPAGDTGATGAQGSQGERGAVGPAGLTFRGAWSSTVDYLQNDSVGYGGGSWFAIVDPPVGAVPVDGSPYWSSMASAGAKGDKGDKGDTGATGAKGDTGAKGTTGDAGAQGVQGVKGDQGIQGVKGDPGAQGIQGVKGDTGAAGTQGVKGDTGAAGTQGVKGDQGAQGVQGVKGDTGATGSAGTQGVKGDTGATGAAGPGLPAGGVAGQVPVKSGTADYATAWGRQGYVGASRSLASDVALTSGQFSTPTFTTINADSDGFTTGTTGNQAFKVPAGKAGLYRVTGFYHVTATANGGVAAVMYRNGGNAYWETAISVPNYSAGGYTASREGLIQLAVGDILTWSFFANANGLTVKSGRAYGEITIEQIA